MNRMMKVIAAAIALSAVFPFAAQAAALHDTYTTPYPTITLGTHDWNDYTQSTIVPTVPTLFAPGMTIDEFMAQGYHTSIYAHNCGSSMASRGQVGAGRFWQTADTNDDQSVDVALCIVSFYDGNYTKGIPLIFTNGDGGVYVRRDMGYYWNTKNKDVRTTWRPVILNTSTGTYAKESASGTVANSGNGNYNATTYDYTSGGYSCCGLEAARYVPAGSSVLVWKNGSDEPVLTLDDIKGYDFTARSGGLAIGKGILVDGYCKHLYADENGSITNIVVQFQEGIADPRYVKYVAVSLTNGVEGIMATAIKAGYGETASGYILGTDFYQNGSWYTKANQDVAANAGVAGYGVYELTATLPATTYYWTGAEGDGKFSTPGNWELGGETATTAPGAGYSVEFDNNAALTVTLDADAEIDSISFNGTAAVTFANPNAATTNTLTVTSAASAAADGTSVTLNCAVAFTGAYEVEFGCPVVFAGGATATCPGPNTAKGTFGKTFNGYITFTQDWTLENSGWLVAPGSTLTGQRLTGTGSIVGRGNTDLRISDGATGHFATVHAGRDVLTLSVQGELIVDGDYTVQAIPASYRGFVGLDGDQNFPNSTVRAHGVYRVISDRNSTYEVQVFPANFYIGAGGFGSTVGLQSEVVLKGCPKVIHATDDFEIKGVRNETTPYYWGLILEQPLTIDTAGHWVTWNAGIRGTGAITKSGLGTLVMQPYGANDNRNVFVNEGTLVFSNAVDNAGAAAYTLAGGAGTLVKAGDGQLKLAVNYGAAGAADLMDLTIRLEDGSLALTLSEVAGYTHCVGATYPILPQVTFGAGKSISDITITNTDFETPFIGQDGRIYARYIGFGVWTWNHAADTDINNAANWNDPYPDDTTTKWTQQNHMNFPANAETESLTFQGVDPLSLGWISVNGSYRLDSTGGLYCRRLMLSDTARLVYDPARTAIRVDHARPNFQPGAKIALAPSYAASTNGKFLLMTWNNADQIPEEELATLFDTASASGTNPKLYQETVGSSTRLWLDLDYGGAANPIKVLAIGDSITQGHMSSYGNWRIAYMKRLAAEGYDPTAVGFWDIESQDICGATMPDEWVRHAGISGQRIRLTSGGCGDDYAIDNILEQAGLGVDVILFKLGTNDLNGNRTSADELFPAWSNMVAKMCARMPLTRIVCGTVVHINDEAKNAQVVAFNAKIKAAIDGGVFPANQVFAADLYEACPRFDANGQYIVGSFYDEGNLHPDWPGEELMADEYLRVTKLAVAAPALTGSEDVPTTSGCENNVPAAYRAGFARARVLDVAAFSASHTLMTTGGEVPYLDATGNAGAVEGIRRVGYYVELKRKDGYGSVYGGRVRWLWVDMAAFGATEKADGYTLADVGVPLEAAVKQKIVRHLHVVGNFPGVGSIPADDETARAFVEFWPYSYDKNLSGIAVPEPVFGYDWNDHCTGTSTYGSMQVHRILEGEEYPAETLFAFNRFTVNPNDPREIGIGSFSIQAHSSTDWTLTSDYPTLNADAYEVAKIEIWTSTTPYANEAGDAGVFTWTGAGSDGKWATGANWDKYYYPPASGETVVFDDANGGATTFNLANSPVLLGGIRVEQGAWTAAVSQESRFENSPINIASGASFTLDWGEGEPAVNPFSTANDANAIGGILDLGGATQAMTGYVDGDSGNNGNERGIFRSGGEVRNGVLNINPTGWMDMTRIRFTVGTGATVSVGEGKTNAEGQMNINGTTLVIDGGTFNALNNRSGSGVYTYIGWTPERGAASVEVKNGGRFYAPYHHVLLGAKVAGSIFGDGGTVDFTTAMTIYMGQENNAPSTLALTNSTLTCNNLLLGTDSATAPGPQTVELVNTVANLRTIGRNGSKPVNANSRILFDGATLIPKEAVNDFVKGADTTIEIGNGGLTITNDVNLTITATLSGGGSLVKTGTGNLTISANQTFTGALVVSNGTLTATGGKTFGGGLVAEPGVTLDIKDAEFQGDVDIGEGVTFTAVSDANWGSMEQERIALLTTAASATVTVPAGKDANGRGYFVKTLGPVKTLYYGKLKGLMMIVR